MIETKSYSKKIYKKDSKGKIRVLHVYAEGNKLVQVSGILDGALVKHESECKPKNVGKANETTAEEQAIAEAKSKIETKMTTGYFETVDEAKNSEVILPMLAKSYTEKAINWEKGKVYIQPKLDGMRCLAFVSKGKVQLLSRKGKEITTMDHIVSDLNKITDDKSYVLDGELYAHGKTFQENMKLIKKKRAESITVRFIVYDIVDANSSYTDRLENLSQILKRHVYNHCKRISTSEIKSSQFITDWHNNYVNLGYEGAIIRHSDKGYEVNKRSSSLLKYKNFIDKVYEIIDVVPSVKNPKQGVIHCSDSIGEVPVSFGCGMKFSQADKEDILKNKEMFIGKKAEIRFFEYTDDGLPRFPVCFGIRLDK